MVALDRKLEIIQDNELVRFPDQLKISKPRHKRRLHHRNFHAFGLSAILFAGLPT